MLFTRVWIAVAAVFVFEAGVPAHHFVGASAGALSEVHSTPGTLTFSSTGTTVTVTVDLPVNAPALENIGLYGSSSSETPADDEANLIGSAAARPSSGVLRFEDSPCAANARYFVQLEFWYHGQDVHSDPATILTGWRTTSGELDLE